MIPPSHLQPCMQAAFSPAGFPCAQLIGEGQKCAELKGIPALFQKLLLREAASFHVKNGNHAQWFPFHL